MMKKMTRTEYTKNRFHRFEYVAHDAPHEEHFWTNQDKALFHYFNDHGLLAEKRKWDDKVRRMVEERKVASGWLFIHGSLNDFHRKALSRLIKMKKVNTIRLGVTLDSIRDEIEDTKEAIREKEAELKS